MPVTDPISDMLTRIRNANTARKEFALVPYSASKKRIADLLKKEGFLKDVQSLKEGPQGALKLFLKYGTHKEKAIIGLKRISKPGLRVYVGKHEIPRIFGGLALVLLSTSTKEGIITDKRARELKVGGEVICYVY